MGHPLERHLKSLLISDLWRIKMSHFKSLLISDHWRIQRCKYFIKSYTLINLYKYIIYISFEYNNIYYTINQNKINIREPTTGEQGTT